MKRGVALLLALILGAAPIDARADDDARVRAAVAFRQARAAFRRDEFAAAAAAFEQAASYELHPATLLDAEEAWESAGEPARAADDCDRVLAMQVDEKFRAEALRRLAALTPRIATLEVRGPRTALFVIDDGPSVPAPAKRRLLPGRHIVGILDLRSSRSEQRVVDVAAGEQRVLEAEPAGPVEARTPLVAPERPIVSPVPPSGHTPFLPAGAIACFGVATGAAAVAGIFGLITLGNQDDFERDRTSATRDSFHRDKAITNGAWAVAGVSLVAGAVMWFATPRVSRTAALAPRPDLTLPF